MLDVAAQKSLANLQKIITDQDMTFNEQTTKHFLILPFLTALGYDITNPTVLKHEFKPANLKGNNDKVDYALDLGDFKIIIEAKPLDTNIKRHYHQLQKYYNSTPEVQLGIITDGKNYHFFTDFYYENLMDIEPFYSLDVLNLTDYDFYFLNLLSYGKISANSVREATEEIIFRDKLLTSFKRTIEELPPEFMRMVVKDFYPHVVTKKVLEKATAIAKQVGVHRLDLSSIDESIIMSNDRVEQLDSNSDSTADLQETETKQESENEVKQEVRNDTPEIPVKSDATDSPEGSNTSSSGETPPPPVIQKKPSLRKGERVTLNDEETVLNKIEVGLGWDVSGQPGVEFDLDVHVFMLNENQKVNSDECFIFYNNPQSPDGSTTLLKDSRDGAGDGDDEIVFVELDKVSPDVEKIMFIVTIYDAENRNQNFSMVDNAFIRMTNLENGEELLRFELTNQGGPETCLIVGEIYRYNQNWKFTAVGNGYQSDIQQLCQNFGVQLA